MNAIESFQARVGMRHPIIQAPMAGTSSVALASAVSNAGGLGSLGLGASAVEEARSQIALMKTQTQAPFNVNVFCHAVLPNEPEQEQAWLDYLRPLFEQIGAPLPTALKGLYRSFIEDDAMFELLLEQAPAVVSFHFGLPSADRIAALRKAGCYTLATATRIEEAAQIEAAGVDAIVAQGIEAGGHRGMFDPDIVDQGLPTSVLVRQLVREQGLPVIAAGGIMDGRMIRSMLDLGAAAAQLGTAFILCPESSAHENYRENLKGPRAADTRLTPVISGRPARGMVNTLIVSADRADRPPVAAYPYAYDAAKQLHAAALKQGIHEFAAQWAGQGAPLAREMPAAELVKTLVEEMKG